MNLNQQQRLEIATCHKEFETELHRILEYWQTYAPDDKNGGFHGAVNLENQAVNDAPRSCVLNARILWTFSAAAIAFPEKNYGRMAKRAYNVLMQYFKDPDLLGFFMELTADNQPSDTVKHTYVQAFVLYALSKYYEYSRDEKVLEELGTFFIFLDGQAKDPSGPGYLEGFSRDWKPILQNRMADENDPKSMNTHLHLLEAYAAVYKVWPNEMVRMRLAQILNIFQHQIIRKDGHLGIFFDFDFIETDLSKSICSFGHDIEASWL
ncbi:MAG: AGE family epimerase/isomerase, partial [Bacteroidota bacterium]|nr:AGE family epimerase/isomerase [Bacteroidota bacterium]